MRLISKISYLTKEGIISIFSHGFMSFASVSIIVACLTIMGIFSLLSVNIDETIRREEAKISILAYIDENLTLEEAMALQSKIEDVDNVKEATFISRDEAFRLFEERYPEREFRDEGIEADVLRHRYEIFLEDITQMAATERRVLSVLGVKKVNAALEISRGFMTMRKIVNATSLILAVILVTVSVFIMANTVKLTTFGRREEIAIMKIVGATNGFIRWPFIIEGAMLGLLGAGLAFLLQWGIYIVVLNRVMTSAAGSFVELVAFDTIMYQFLATFLGIGFSVGAFGGIVAIRNYLKV